MIDNGMGFEFLMMQLSEQHREMMNLQLAHHVGYDALLAQYNKLVDDYNHLLDKFEALQRRAKREKQEADAKIEELEKKLNSAEASADTWRWDYVKLFKSIHGD